MTKELFLTIKELKFLISILKDREFKLRNNNLNYSSYFKKVECNLLENLIKKIDNFIITEKKEVI